ncbi:MAG: hypothetical protein U0Q10_05450 [Dermatophilaceae bacterium]
MARAVYTDDECLRILQAAGLADELHADMLVGLPIQWIRADGQVLAHFHDESTQWLADIELPVSTGLRVGSGAPSGRAAGRDHSPRTVRDVCRAGR